MEKGTTIVSTEEYLELRAMRDNLEARKKEIEENADMIIEEYRWGCAMSHRIFIGKDEALNILQGQIDNSKKIEETLRSSITTLSIEVQKNDPAKLNRSFPARLRFLFTGELSRKGE